MKSLSFILQVFSASVWKKYPILRFIWVIPLSLLISIPIDRLNTGFIDFFLYDQFFRLRPNPSPPQDVALVYYDLKTVSQFNGLPDYPVLIETLEKISQAKPLAIVSTLPQFSKESLSDAMAIPSQNEFLQTAVVRISKIPNLFFATTKMYLIGEQHLQVLPPPFDSFPVISWPRTVDGEVLGQDQVTRRFIVDYQGVDYGHWQIAQLAMGSAGSSKASIGREKSQQRGLFELYESNQGFINFRIPGSFPSQKIENLLVADTEKLSNDFHGKIVVLGDGEPRQLSESIRTPFSRDPAAMSLLEMHANILQTLIDNSSIKRSSDQVNFALIVILFLGSLFAVLKWHPLTGVIYLFSSGALLLLLAFLLFWLGDFFIPLGKPLLALFLSYYFLIPYRLIVEIRKNLEYKQKNKMLSQIEELKTNFISMMSHDLKTPLARIQGMTQVVKQDAKHPLTTEQVEALDHIQNSASDLVKFVDVVLKYAQVENQQVQLHKESRDINQLIEEVIKKHDFLLRLRQIKLVKELEPLFPIDVDPELIKQVLGNLVENAIKYSPAGSKILITSEEQSGAVRVQISDQGQGIAPQDLPYVFMKFFRSSAVKSSDIKGSGLGLYLADYFVKLHGGRIEVESELGQGSTFTVELPLYSKA